MDRKQAIRIDISDFEGLEVVGIEACGPKTLVEVLADFLNRRDRFDVIGCLALIVVAIQSRSIEYSPASVVVSVATMIFASFVILIGRQDVSSLTKTVKNDSRITNEGKGQAGESQRGDRPELVRGYSEIAGSLRPSSIRVEEGWHDCHPNA